MASLRTLIGRVNLGAVSRANVSGTAQEGQTLTATAGSWSGKPTPTLAYQWQRCDAAGECGDIVGATATTYRLTAADVNTTVQVLVTGTNAAGSDSAHSAQTGDVAPATPVAPGSTADPTITAVAAVG